MKQVGLNTLAILVGCITFSALLSPLLRLSPLWPTLITASLLGLVTIDSLRFQGQGVTLFLDWFAQRSPQHRQRLLHHEAGHFLVAYLLGISITGYTLSAWEASQSGQSGQGGVQFAPPPDQGMLSASLLQRYCTVWMAGGVAEVLVYNSVEGGQDDLERLRTTLTRLGLDWRSPERTAVQQARQLLQTHWSTYEALVAAMAQRASVAACCQLIDQKSNLPRQQMNAAP